MRGSLTTYVSAFACPAGCKQSFSKDHANQPNETTGKAEIIAKKVRLLA